MGERTCVIVNPASGRGRGRRMIPAITAAFGEYGVTDIRTTSGTGDDATIARAAISDNCRTLVVVGGDGTSSNVANAILHSGVDVKLAVIPAGTGNDFAKLLGTAKMDARDVARLCAEGSERRVDAGKVEEVHFLNCCGFGFDVAVLEGIARNSWLRGNAVYVYTALTQLFDYRGFDVAVGDRASVRHLLLVFANAAHFGGTFEIAPGALATDGQLDAVSILDIPPLKRIAVLAAAMRGKHEQYRETVRAKAAEFEVTFDSPPVYETDGELHRARSSTLTVSSCPGALRVIQAV